MMLKYENLLNLEKWNIDELNQAIRYYNWCLSQPHDDVEHSALLHAIDQINMRKDELNGVKQDWELLFQ